MQKSIKSLFTLFVTACFTLPLAACSTTVPPSSSSFSSAGSAETSALTGPQTTPGIPTITVSKAQQNYKEESTTLLNAEWNTAKVTIPGNKTAEQAIQADLDQITKSFIKTSEDYRKEAKEFQEVSDAESSLPFYHGLFITPARRDSSVVSLVFDENDYTGGAHGSDYRYARNYDAQTGRVLKLSELGDGVKKTACKKIVTLANLIHKKDGLFFDSIRQSDLKDVVTDDMFYFNQTGLVFICGQYMIQSYVEGIVEFTISYDDLHDSLAKSYQLSGGNTQCSTAQGNYTLNKDGTLDTSQVQYEENTATAS